MKKKFHLHSFRNSCCIRNSREGSIFPAYETILLERHKMLLKVRKVQNEVVALPKIWSKKIGKFCPDTMGTMRQNFSKYIHSEISWPLHNSLSTAKLVCYRPAMYQISLTILLAKSCNNHQLAAIAAQLTDWPQPNMEPPLAMNVMISVLSWPSQWGEFFSRL